MQPPASSSSSSSGHDPIRGSSSSSGSGLARFRSAPASASASASSWLESLLNDADEDLALKPSPSLQYHGGSLTQLLTSGACSTSTSTTTTTSYGAASSSSGPRVSSSYRSIIESPNLGFLDLGGGVDHSATNLTFARQNSSPADFLGGGHDDGYFAGFGIPASYDYLGSSSSPGKPVREDSDSQHRFVSGLTEEEQRSGSLQSGVDGFLDVGMDKLLEDFVPCRVRAKRGCATHPRSISERVRRTRISDRIKKLQELVPNMDKQTNTADMLEEAVEYVKRLQKQIQELTEQQKQCKCGASNRP